MHLPEKKKHVLKGVTDSSEVVRNPDGTYLLLLGGILLQPKEKKHLSRKLTDAQLCEYLIPDLTGLTEKEASKRMGEIRIDRLVASIKKIHLITGIVLNAKKYGTAYPMMAMVGVVKPVGPYKEELESLIQTKDSKIAFVCRYLTLEKPEGSSLLSIVGYNLVPHVEDPQDPYITMSDVILAPGLDEYPKLRQQLLSHQSPFE